MFYLRHRRHRKNIRKELIEVIQDARYRFNGDTRHDSHVVHQAIYNYWLDKNVAYSSFIFIISGLKCHHIWIKTSPNLVL